MTSENQTFITEYLRHRSEYTAYCLAYNPQNASDYDAIMSAASQLLDDPETGGLIRSIEKSIRHEVEQEIRAELKTELLTVQSKRELLAKIARGKMTAVQHYKGKDCNHCTQIVLPTINQVLRAIDLDNRMAGHYPVKQFAVNSQQQHPETSGQLTKMENNPKTQQTTTNRIENSPPYEGGENCKQRIAVSNSGWSTHAGYKTLRNHNKTQQFTLPKPANKNY